MWIEGRDNNCRDIVKHKHKHKLLQTFVFSFPLFLLFYPHYSPIRWLMKRVKLNPIYPSSTRFPPPPGSRFLLLLVSQFLPVCIPEHSSLHSSSVYHISIHLQIHLQIHKLIASTRPIKLIQSLITCRIHGFYSTPISSLPNLNNLLS